jgi:hypothetical protein
LQSPAWLPDLMKTLLAQSKTLSSAFVVIPLLGTAVDVSTHLNLKGIGDANLTSVSGEIKVLSLTVA